MMTIPSSHTLMQRTIPNETLRVNDAILQLEMNIMSSDTDTAIYVKQFADLFISFVPPFDLLMCNAILKTRNSEGVVGYR